jgi:hypothetical protein
LGAAGNIRKKKGGLGGRPKFFSVFQSDVDDRNDPVVAVDDDDLIANDEVHVPAPLGMDFDERGGGTSTTRTLVGRVVPTRREKLTLLTRGAFPPAKTVCRICVRCCVVRFTLPPAWPCCA